MKAAFTGVILLDLVFSTTPCLAHDEVARGKVISEEEARTISAHLYADILITACKNGWRYPLQQVASGFERHFKELKLQLSNDGYTIVSMTVNDNDERHPAMMIASGERKSPTFGCAHPYWLEIRDRIALP
ncbi:hypothetical protein [Rhizobium herbae]|uniref:Uncharacterized protein n=1 Tax=Rhizobium herbae TaxID=508661 RepID=A0ABS4EW09_9HYPH|nr:hypothetical protein [Rhizobium herbae]MBP1862102.1 hypothetical protein [Rhizobium herbae]